MTAEAKTGSRASGAIRTGVGVAVAAAMAAVFAISFAAIIYSGELAPFLSRGIGLTLAGSALMGALGAFLFSYRGTICQPQDVTTILLGIGAAGMAASWQGSPESLFASVVALIVLAGLVTGIAGWVVARLRWAVIARFMPFPVLGGFMAASGYLLLAGAIGMATGTTVDLWSAPDLLSPALLWRWLPWTICAAVIVAATRIFRHDLVLPLSVLTLAATFYVALFASGSTMAEARASGWLLGPFEGSSLLAGLAPAAIEGADWQAVLRQSPTLLAVVGMAILGSLLNASGLELALKRDIDPDRDLRATGLCNIAGAIAAAPVGYAAMAETIFARQMGLKGPVAGLSAAAGCAVALVMGADVLEGLPVGLFVAVVAFLGMDLLYIWLWEKRDHMVGRDFAIVLLILAAAATVGFLPALALGMLAASFMFILSYARLEVVRMRGTLETLRSRVDRDPDAIEYLAHTGGCAVVFELTGFLFFGTAHRLLERLRGELAVGRPRFLILDFARVSGMDASAAVALARIVPLCAKAGTELFVTGMSRDAARRFARATEADSRFEVLPGRDDAVFRVEQALLAERDAPEEISMPALIAEIRSLDSRLDPERFFDRIRLEEGETLLEQGSDCRDMFVLCSGRMRAEMRHPDGNASFVAGFLPGALIGEIAFYASVPRTAAVLAEEPSELLRITHAILEGSPEGRRHAEALHRIAARYMARRMMRMNRLIAEAGL